MVAMSQYDAVADDYHVVRARLPIYDVFDHSLLARLGDVSGQSVLDVACGAGWTARLLKRCGAARVLGVDASRDQVRLAEAHEAREPLGIEYRACAAQDLAGLGAFDLVTATFLLNYAESRAQLRQIARRLYDHVAPGGRFVAINDHGGALARADPATYRRYGFAHHGDPGFADGDPATLELETADGEWMEIEVRSFHKASYEQALRGAGFSHVAWHPLVVPAELTRPDDPAFWAALLDAQPIAVLEAVRAP
jgi:toxoflavin synthase